MLKMIRCPSLSLWRLTEHLLFAMNSECFFYSSHLSIGAYRGLLEGRPKVQRQGAVWWVKTKITIPTDS